MSAVASYSPRYLIVVGGTWETRWGILRYVVDNSPAWTPIWVNYPASYGTPEAFIDSEDQGIAALITKLYALADDGAIALVGYSQGAGIIERALRDLERLDLARARNVLARIVYVGLCGNPYRAEGDQVGDDPGGFGVIGPLAARGAVPIPLPDRWQNFSLPGDLISSCPRNSLVRGIFPFTKWMSPQRPEKWALDVLSKASYLWVIRNVPELRNPARWPELAKRVHQASVAAYYYQESGIHRQYMIRPVGINKVHAGRYIVRALEEITNA